MSPNTCLPCLRSVTRHGKESLGSPFRVGRGLGGRSLTAEGKCAPTQGEEISKAIPAGLSSPVSRSSTLEPLRSAHRILSVLQSVQYILPPAMSNATLCGASSPVTRSSTLEPLRSARCILSVPKSVQYILPPAMSQRDPMWIIQSGNEVFDIGAVQVRTPNLTRPLCPVHLAPGHI